MIRQEVQGAKQTQRDFIFQLVYMKFRESALRMLAVGHALPLLLLLCPGRSSGNLLPSLSTVASPAGAAGNDATRLGGSQCGGDSFYLGGIGGSGNGDGPNRVRVRKSHYFDPLRIHYIGQ